MIDFFLIIIAAIAIDILWVRPSAVEAIRRLNKEIDR
jgi:hypothetical protein